MINVGNSIVNTYLYKINDGYVMIDTGYNSGYKKVIKKLNKINISIKEIKYIVLTHAHDDHAGFLNEMLEQNNNIKVIMSEKGLDVLKKGQNSFQGGCSGRKSYIFCMIMKLIGKGKHTFPPIKEKYESNLVLISKSDIETLEKEIEAKILETPGHTNDSISLLTKNNELLCGDVAMNGFPSKNNIIIWIENKKEYKESWEKIIKINPIVIYPAHGKSFLIEKLKKNIIKIDSIKLYSLKP